MQRMTMASSTGSGLSLRMARWVSIASCNGMSRPFSTSASVLACDRSVECAASVMFPPDLEAEVEEPAHVVDVGVEVGHAGHDFGKLRQLRALLLLPLGDHLEVQVALPDLAQNRRHPLRIGDQRLDGMGHLGGVGAH